MTKNKYEIIINYDNTANDDFELMEEFIVIEKDNGKPFICLEPVSNCNPEFWDTETSTGQRINKNKVNGY